MASHLSTDPEVVVLHLNAKNPRQLARCLDIGAMASNGQAHQLCWHCELCHVTAHRKSLQYSKIFLLHFPRSVNFCIASIIYMQQTF